MFYIFYAVAAIAGPQHWTANESLRFEKGITTDFVCLGSLMVVFAAFGMYVQWESRRRDREQEGNVGEGVEGEGIMEMDMTDKEEKAFRYTA